MKYFSEVVLLIKTNSIIDFETWIKWYLYSICFDHIVVYNNDSFVDLKSICNKYNIEYHEVHGWCHQASLYNEHLRNTKAQWVAFLDADEFLYISEQYDYKVNNYIKQISSKFNCNKLAFNMVNMFSYDTIAVRDAANSFITNNIYYNPNVPNSAYHKLHSTGNYLLKNIINTDTKWTFFNESDISKYYITYVHNPHVLNADGSNSCVPAYFENGNSTIYIEYKQNKSCEGCFVAHYQFRSEEEWKAKCMLGRVSKRNNDLNTPDKLALYNEVYKYKNRFLKCTLVRDRYFAIKDII
jgi:hypothetical protein